MTFTSRWIAGAAALLVIAAVAAACAMTPAVDYDKVALDMIKGSFRAQGQAGIERLQQDEAQRICSGPTAPSPADPDSTALFSAATSALTWSSADDTP